MSSADSSRSFAALLTGAGRGAVAVIGVRGPRAEDALARHFRRAVAAAKEKTSSAAHCSNDRLSPSLMLRAINEAALRRILYGTWQPIDETKTAAEDIVLTRFETHWELGCHGGAIAAPAILADLAAAGIETVTWQEWLALTSANRLQASAAVALAAAHTQDAALALLRAAKLTVTALRELIECFGDHTSGSSDLIARSTACSSPGTQVSSEMQAKPQALIAALLDTARWARRLTTPWNIVLAGLPNAGKSSLLNALVGYERAIVFAEPGTTRDVVTASATYEGWRWELRDTAGLRATDDALEAAGIERTTAALTASDVTVLVIDGTRPWSESAELRRAYPHAIVVRNKSDLWAGNAAALPETNQNTIEQKDATEAKERQETSSVEVAQATIAALAISTITGEGLEELRAAIHARLNLPAWSDIGACVWDAALEHDLRTLERVLREDPAALPVALRELLTWIV